MKISDLSQNWLKFSWEYRPSAFYFWNEDMEIDRIESMLSKMEKDQIREVLFHPVHGLTIEYLSDEFAKIYKNALKLAKKHNIKVWIYDEYSWPSGCVGGKLLREYPQYGGWYLSYENGIAKPKKSNRLHDGTTGAPWTQGERGYLDTLNYDAVNCFININYEKLKEICGEYWEDTIRGFFTDEPAAMIPDGEGSFWFIKALPWTEKLPQIFKEMNGYDIEPLYNDLFKNENSKLKTDYFKVVKYLHSTAYHKQIGDWCKKNNKEYTGHVGEDCLTMEVNFGGSIYQNLSNMTSPGVDFLNFNDPDQKIDEEIVASIAKHSSSDKPKKVYSESFGISRYSLTLKELYNKWTGLSVQRVNDIALMGMQHSTSSVRKRTYWPPFTEDEPWWDYYGAFRDSAARAMGISNLGKDIRKYAILYPQYELEQHAFDGSYNDIILKKVFSMIDFIEKSQNQYDWIFPEMLNTGKVVNGRIVFPKETYDGIVINNEIDYFETSKDILKTFENNGGKIISSFNETLEQPIWHNILKIDSSDKIRVYTYEYEDGYMIAIRNIGETNNEINVDLLDNTYYLNQWVPDQNKIYNVNSSFNKEIEFHSNVYFSITKEKISNEEYPKLLNKELDINFTFKAEKYNTAPFNSVQALHKDKGLIDLTKISANETSIFYKNNENLLNTNGFPTLSKDFFGAENIEFQCDFYMEDLCKIGIIGESKYIKDIELNGIKLNKPTRKEFIWDYTNVYYDFTDYVKLGNNSLKFTLGFEAWETSIINEAFFAFNPMPSVDVCLVGDFLFKNNKIYKYSDTKQKLPIDLSTEGFNNTYGKVILEGHFTKTSEMENIYINLNGDSPCQVLIDNKSIGSQIKDYIFSLENISNDTHNIKIILTGTSASLMDYERNNVWKLLSIIY